MTLKEVQLKIAERLNADSVRKLQADIFEADIEGLDGSRFVIQVKINPAENNGHARLWTFFRTKKERASP